MGTRLDGYKIHWTQASVGTSRHGGGRLAYSLFYLSLAGREHTEALLHGFSFQLGGHVKAGLLGRNILRVTWVYQLPTADVRVVPDNLLCITRNELAVSNVETLTTKDKVIRLSTLNPITVS